MKDDRLPGIWSCPSFSFPDHQEVLVYNDSLDRIVVFVTMETDPPKRVAMKLWCNLLSSGRLETRVKPGTSDSKKTDYSIEGNLITLDTGSSRQICRRLSPSEVPAWLETELAKAYEAMDQKEAEQVRPANPATRDG